MIWKSDDIYLDGVNTRNYYVKPRNRVIVPTAERVTEYIEIKGRDSPLTKKYGYKNIPLPIDFYIFERNKDFELLYRIAKSKMFNANTLRVGDAGVYYIIKNIDVDEAINPNKEIGEFTMHFTLDPFAYELDNEPVTITSQKTIINDGYTALPIITAQVSGTGKIYINEQEITIQNVNGSITIDSEMQNAYRKGNPPQNMNNHMIGHFPVLEHGDNVVSFDGGISELEIICNRRWR